jgi:hypothetical protein
MFAKSFARSQRGLVPLLVLLAVTLGGCAESIGSQSPGISSHAVRAAAPLALELPVQRVAEESPTAAKRDFASPQATSKVAANGTLRENPRATCGR